MALSKSHIQICNNVNDLKTIMLREVSQRKTEKDKHYSLTCGTKTKTKTKLIGTENRLVVAKDMVGKVVK